ncbi:5'-flap endonuclease [Reticulomyxa filosa]|uniref:5'-flap endonuclease n=1 Tax=Reticulomyxa filosa TaxID=46433 RepID=X6MYY1_RETFI|nr:5'-flap endonuclease [Reticulomyxa filosa]|eukprot:ETO18699.1 5'-flap endonuclease [Reticulomyxa filosa]
MLCAFSMNEAARYLESFKIFENKSIDVLKGSEYDRGGHDSKDANDNTSDYTKRFAKQLPNQTLQPNLNDVSDILTEIRAVNKTNVATLVEHFGSLAALSAADEEALANLPGIGPTKIKNILNVFDAPFSLQK